MQEVVEEEKGEEEEEEEHEKEELKMDKSRRWGGRKGNGESPLFRNYLTSLPFSSSFPVCFFLN